MWNERRVNRALPLMLCLSVVEFVRGGFFLSLYPVYATAVLHFSVGLLGLILSAHYVCETLFKIAAGAALDAYSRRQVLFTGLVCGLVGLICTSYVENPWVSVLGAALWGVGLSPVWLAVLGAGRQLGEGQGRWMSRAYAFWLVGIGLGPIAVSFCLNWPAEWVLWGLVGMWVLAVVLAAATGDDRMGTGARTPGWTKDMTQFLVKRWGILAGVVVQTAAAGMLVPVFETYAHTVLGLTNTQYGLLLLVGGAFVVALMLLIGRLVDERGPRIWLVSGFLLCGAAVAWLGAFPPMHWTTLAAVLAVLAVGYGLVMPSWNAFVASVIPEDRQATAWGVYTTAEGCGISIGPVIGGAIAGMWGLITPFIVSGILLTGLGVVYGIRMRRIPSSSGTADLADASDSGARR